MTINVQVKILDERLRGNLPAYATGGSAGMDLKAAISGSFHIDPGECVKIPTGIAIYMQDPNVAAIMLPRSGLGHKGIVLGNLVGLVDSDYQGPLMVSLWNRGESRYLLEPLDRIAQLVFMPVLKASFQEVEEWEHTTARGQGGYGSTGVRNG